MKKKIILFSMFFIVLMILTGCGSKKAITTKEFINITENNGYVIVDAKDQFDYDYIKEATIAKEDDYQLEFYVLDNISNANGMFEHNKSIFESYKDGISAETSTNIGNYSTYSLQSGGYYMYLSRVDNTLLYIRVKGIYKDNVKNIVDKIGY